MTKMKWSLVFGVGFLVLVGIIGWLVMMDLDNESTFPDRGLPIVEIDLNEVSLDEIKNGSKDIKYKGNELNIYDNDKTLKYENVEVKGRGNSSWVQPKKSYQIRFEREVDLLGMEKVKKWVLLANYYDHSLMRNDIALMLADALGEEYSFMGDFVELYFDGKYEGVYYLIKKIELANGSVDLRNEKGVLFELDSLHREEEKCYTSYLGDCLVLKESVLRDEAGKQNAASDFLLALNRAEVATVEKDYEKVAEEIDMESFAKYFLVNEFTVNPDAYSSSFYLYKDGGKIHAGPIWDFDFALGNHVWEWQIDERSFSPYESMIREREAFGYDGLNEDLNISKLFYYLMRMPEFREEVSRIFQEKLSGKKEEFTIRIMNKINEINAAAIADGEKWDERDFNTETTTLIDWFKKRYQYFEETYGNGKANENFDLL